MESGNGDWGWRVEMENGDEERDSTGRTNT